MTENSRKKPTKLKSKSKEFVPYEEQHEVRPLILFLVIIPSEHDRYIKKLYDEFDVSACFFTNAEGSATSDRLEKLGLPNNKKKIALALIREDKAGALKRKLNERFATSKAASGVAICIKLTSIAGVTLYKFLTNNRKVK